MIFDLQHSPPPDTAHDVVIVGGGTVALLLAVLLERGGQRVLVLETGGGSFEAPSQALNDATVTGRAHTGISVARGRALGGTSNLWGGQLTGFVPSDFEARAGVADAPWPISYDDLLPWYEAVARELRLADVLDESTPQAHKLFGEGFPDIPGFTLFLTRWLKEPAMARYFRERLHNAPNLTVLLHAHATGLDLAPDGEHITSVRVALPDGTSLAIQGRRFVLANGTIEIARLLLASAVELPQAPWANNTWVGAGFQDHLEMRGARVHLLDKPRFLRTFQNIVLGGHKYQPKLRLDTGPATAGTGAALNVTGYFAFESSIAEHLQHLKVLVRSLMRGGLPRQGLGLNLGEVLRHVKGMGSAWVPMIVQYLRHHRIYNPGDRGVWLVMHAEQLPRDDSRITLDPERKDRFGMPLASLDWRIGGQPEVRAMAAFVRRIGDSLLAAGLARVEIDALLDTEDTRVLDHARDTFHQCGGARMGHHAGDGVVDSELRVFGTRNLFVAGAAVFRTSSYANPTFTAMALTARLAERLQREPATA
ncbi:GMC oxidoreductase family protein [Hydrogenophaga sp. RAC07]|uniref:GMC oxidoreductase n=1 Tax=Hydrogenophaga sp. RAC07 TaxID=1842537 RepID=UPI00083D4088|nr:GMC family oxidoreductase [Hydrogenophaga sp. RAC07]AOF84320.1 GMC oxidoreductase family protein [Hydrogenophaga sp. RAC07]